MLRQLKTSGNNGLWQGIQVLLIFSLLIPNIGFGQSLPTKFDDTGLPFITNYRSADYNAALENWGIVQDNRGILYFANTRGILEFDGQTWRQIDLPQKAFVRSLSLGKDGKIYVAAVSDLGVLEPDTQGFLEFRSQKALLGSRFKHLGEVWDVEAAKGAVYYKTKDFLFRITGDSVKSWSARETFRIYQVDGRIYVRNNGVGLMQLQNDSLQLIPGGENFAHVGVYDMLPHNSKGVYLPHNIIITTINRGLFIYDGQQVKPFATHLKPLLSQMQIYSSALLPDSSYVFATMRGGIVIMDAAGRLIRILDKSSGLLSSVVYFVYASPQSGIWLALNNGISHIEWPSPLTKFDNRHDSRGNVYSVQRYRGKIFIGDDLGVQKLDFSSKNGFPPLLTPMPFHDPCYKLQEINGTLLALANSLLYQINPDFTFRIVDDINGTRMVASRFHKDRVYILAGEAVSEIRKEKNDFIFSRNLAAPLIAPWALAEENDSILWILDNKSLLFRYQHQGKNLPRIDSLPPLQRYDGVLGEVSDIVPYEDKLLFLAKKGIFTYNAQKNNFESFNFYGVGAPANTKTLPIYRLVPFRENDWIAERGFDQEKEIGFLIRRANRTYDWQPLSLLNRIDLRYVQEIYPDPNQDVLWISASDAVIRFEYQAPSPPAIYKPPIIRMVRTNNDSILFGGYLAARPTFPLRTPELTYRFRNMEISYSAPIFSGPEAVLFSSKLENFDESWSGWSPKTQKHYTNLPFGEFKFLVKAKDRFGNESPPVSYAFVILPPWYHSWWAYAFYAVLLVSGILTTDRILRRRIVLREREKSRMRELELQARKNEAQAQATIAQAKALEAENERKRNVELLNNIGREITSSLDFETVFLRLYYHMRNIAVMDVFEIGVLKEEQQIVEFQYSIQDKRRLQVYELNLGKDNPEIGSCLKQKVMILLDSHHLHRNAPHTDSSPTGRHASHWSIVYIPLVSKKKAFGLLHIASQKKNSFSRRQLEIFQNLAPFAAIALDNAMNYLKLNQTLMDLKSTQQRLITQEKLASLGALTAGIAHEIKNPLNFITNFAHLTLDQTKELSAASQPLLKNLPNQKAEEILEILQDLHQNAVKIYEHGKRADRIVKSMLEHSGSNRAERRETDINKLLDDALNLSYHGMRAQNSGFNVEMEKHFAENLQKVEVNPQELNRVFLNLLNNAFYAVQQRAIKSRETYRPQVKIKTKASREKLTVIIWDNGCGVPGHLKNKLFDPFFTTKPSGEGTGLGLSLSHEIIVQNYHGELSFRSREGKYTEFIIQLPITA